MTPPSSWTMEMKTTTAGERCHFYDMESTRKYWHFDFKFTNTNAIIPVSSRGAKQISSLVIASPLGAKQSLTKRLRLPRRYAPRNDNLLYEVVALRSQRRIATPFQGSQ
jgi:hypothetical protein